MPIYRKWCRTSPTVSFHTQHLPVNGSPQLNKVHHLQLQVYAQFGCGRLICLSDNADFSKNRIWNSKISAEWSQVIISNKYPLHNIWCYRLTWMIFIFNATSLLDFVCQFSNGKSWFSKFAVDVLVLIHILIHIDKYKQQLFFFLLNIFYQNTCKHIK